MSRKACWLLLVALTLAIAIALGLQRGAMAPLRAEIAFLHEQKDELERLEKERRRLAALQVPAAEFERLRTERDTAVRLRRQIEELQGSLKKAQSTPVRADRSNERFAPGKSMPAAEWRNAGTATPACALETVLWAAAGGDVEAFARVLLLDRNAEKPARELLERMPPGTRAQYNSPESLLAFLSIRDVPTGQATVREWKRASGRVQPVEVALTSPDGRGREVTLVFVQEPISQTWKLAVMPGAVAKYAAALREKN